MNGIGYVHNHVFPSHSARYILIAKLVCQEQKAANFLSLSQKKKKKAGEKFSTGYAELTPQIKTKILCFIVNIRITQKYRPYNQHPAKSLSQSSEVIFIRKNTSVGYNVPWEFMLFYSYHFK